jgi:hypothetical protein
VEVIAALPRYSPIRYLPTSNSDAVSTAPTPTSRQPRRTGGSSLKIAANSAVITSSATKEDSAVIATEAPMPEPQ